MALSRRTFIRATGATAAATALGVPARTSLAQLSAEDRSVTPLPLRFAVKYPMVGGDAPMVEKFALLKRLGFDGVEMDSPADYSQSEVREASAATGLPVHGVVDSVHWQIRLSDPDPAVRARGRAALEGALRDAKAFGGSSVLLVPGRVTDAESHQQVWDRSIEQIRAVLPLAAMLGIHILIENVWNGFGYDHDGADDQGAERFAAYIDAIDSPWVGMYFDLGNHRRYGDVGAWVRTLGSRIVKLDVKGWGKANGFCRIGDGDVDWADVRKALAEIRYTGWCTAEVGGGDEARLAEIRERMEKALRG